MKTRIARVAAGSRSGSALVVVMIISGILMMIVGASLSTSVAQIRMVDRSTDFKQAMGLAESGLEQAVWNINNEVYDGTYETTIANVGEFLVRVNGSATSEAVAVSTGYIPTRRGFQVARRIVAQIHIGRDPPYFDYGIYARNDLRFEEAMSMASYDSLVESHPNNIIEQLNESHTFGNIACHGDASFSNGSTVFGTIQTGGTISGPGDLMGNDSQQPLNLNVDGLPNTPIPGDAPLDVPEFPEQEMIDAMTTNDNATGISDNIGTRQAYDPVTKSISVFENNKVVRLAGGSTDNPKIYYLTGIALTGNNCELVVQPPGEVVVYLQGDFICNNSADVNVSGTPFNLKIFQKDGNILFDNAGTIHAAIFAPYTNIVVRNTFEMGGSLVGNNVTMSNSGVFYYDEDLGRRQNRIHDVTVYGWLEVAPPSRPVAAGPGA